MKEQYFVLRHGRSGWIMECAPTTFKSARSQKEKLISRFGRGTIVLCRVVPCQ